jgi:arsenate reductase-like glutaredoxin family protein
LSKKKVICIFEQDFEAMLRQYENSIDDKCNDTKKAERFFKERGIKYQFIDMKEKG